MSTTVLADYPKRTARKAYQCYFCGQSIAIGEVHGYRTGVNYGDFWTMRHHPECDAWASEHWDEGDYECHEVGEFVRPTKTEATP